ncbi:unnamed protein product [Urochloa humidicola]
MHPPVTDLELVDVLVQRLHGLPPAPAQPFTVHDNISIFNCNHSYLYDKYGGGSADCVYFFCSDVFTYQDGWKVVAGTQPVVDDGGAVVGWKDTLVFHEGSRWLPRTRWAMDEFQKGLELSGCPMRLYRLRRL